jgi:hypothetical protein
MLVKSNSVPNFLFETPKPQKKQYLLKLSNFPKIIPYSEFLKNNPKATKAQRREAIVTFYNKLLHT